WRSWSSTTTTTATAACAKSADGAFRKSNPIIGDNQAVPVSATAIQRRDSCSSDRIEHSHMTARGRRILDEYHSACDKRSVATRIVFPCFRQHVIGAELIG